MQASTHNKKIAFLVGSPLSMQEKADAPQVPGVSAMLQLIRKRIPAQHLEQFNAELKAGKDNAYQWAMKFLQDRSNRGVANEVIREAVRLARTNPQRDAGLTDAQLDDDFGGWALPPATLHLGKLLAEHPNHFGPILTTNFDPLISASVKVARGEFLRTVLDRDEPFSQAKLSATNVAHIIHLHGYWLNAETLHTPIEIARERKRVTADIENLLSTHTLVVVGYGGWDDVFTQTLSSINTDRHRNIDILWAFFDSETDVVQARNRHFLTKVRELTGRNQLRLYGGINCHELFAKLRDDFGTRDIPATAPAQAPASSGADSSPPLSGGGIGTSPTTKPIANSAPPHQDAPSRPHPSPRAGSTTAQTSTEPPPKESRSNPGKLVALVAIPLFAGGLAIVTQREVERRETGTDLPPPVNAIRVEQKPVFRPVVAPFGALSVLRQQHRVSPASPLERGSRIDQLPRGRYGFVRMESVTSFNAATPIFTGFRDGIEVHRTPANELFLVGYVDPRSNAELATGRPANINLAPVQSDKLPHPASIPVARLATATVRQDNGARVLSLQLNGPR
ncbi:SIR2 family protein [Corallococcus sicarius]|uniref:SIR2 family protein n=1 Tax=Corallococcus sicarius TaxID=2316726 RepID=UPI0013157071|nr:SIR2 family protein [Corallococcus sicarius]